jgi:hypothetical protein
MNCPLCGGSYVKTSRIRLSDVPELCVVRFPVRCWDCVWRFRVWLPQLLFSKMMKKATSRITAEKPSHRRRRESLAGSR